MTPHEQDAYEKLYEAARRFGSWPPGWGELYPLGDDLTMDITNLRKAVAGIEKSTFSAGYWQARAENAEKTLAAIQKLQSKESKDE